MTTNARRFGEPSFEEVIARDIGGEEGKTVRIVVVSDATLGRHSRITESRPRSDIAPPIMLMNAWPLRSRPRSVFAT
jgi:hypothetical protein